MDDTYKVRGKDSYNWWASSQKKVDSISKLTWYTEHVYIPLTAHCDMQFTHNGLGLKNSESGNVKNLIAGAIDPKISHLEW